MKGVVEILLAIGIFVNVLKGADLILRPKQQAWIQGKFETLTLWLDYTKPLEWYTRFKSRKTKLVIIIAGSLLYFGIDIRILITNWNEFFVYWLLMRVLIIAAFTWQFLDHTRQEHPLIKFILRGQKFTLFLLRPILIIVMVIAINLAFVITLIALYWLYTSDQLMMLIICLYSFLLLLAALMTLNIPIPSLEMLAVLSLIILCISIILLISEVIFRILRGIAWRIVEYNKGAYAAIVLLITICLGMVELYIKVKGA